MALWLACSGFDEARMTGVVGSECKGGRRLILLEDIVGAAKMPRCTGLEWADEDQRRIFGR